MAADVPFPHPRLDVFKLKGPAATRILSDPGPSHNRRGSSTLTTPIAGGPGPTTDISRNRASKLPARSLDPQRDGQDAAVLSTDALVG
jgi:hypothetical protein